MSRIRPRHLGDLNPARLVTASGADFAQGFLAAANLVDELYTRQSAHPYLLGDCLLLKANLLSRRRRPRRNPYVGA